MQTYQVTCHECGEQKWPYLAVKPATYVCVLCQSGAGAARRGAARASSAVRKLAGASKRELEGGA